jgi:hypothetical protein
MQPSGACRCPKCSGEVRDGWRVCPACATPLAAEADTETAHLHVSPPSSSSSAEEGRFPAGTVLAGRYRILGLLGQGGMGEVYRAYDLILNQAVALKFLAAPQVNEAALVRFRNEVRIARQVSHPNVCRVYDIGFVEGFHFLSMEYLDGEDLDSLLRRIGRLPQDKAIEFTRKICAGLSAAHERGVLHRDLKPSNIMIDGRGQVRITDFGLAGLAAEIPLSDLRSGTPAYMSPEQKAGKEVTTRSDLYSLGLVLYEMFTGKRRTDTQTNPTDLVKDLDPAVERLILRCLEEDPKRRPSSALNVAMALPGGDPIAAALAAGETPSPEMVAASGEKEGFSAHIAIVCFIGVLVLLATISAVTGRLGLLNLAPLNIPPDGLAFKAQEVLKQLGYSQQPASVAYGYQCCNQDSLQFFGQYDVAHRNALLASHQPPVISFWYRQHHDQIVADSNAGGRITYDSPPNSEPGMVRLILDPKGRLVSLEAQPPPTVSANGTVPDWGPLFAVAGLDPSRFKPTTLGKTPPMAIDVRMAWTGNYTEGHPETVRVEAAAWEGKPVFFQVSGARRQTGKSLAEQPFVGRVIGIVLIILIFGGAVLLARYNLRMGRGDRRGAAKLAATVFVLGMCQWVLRAAHVASPWELKLLADAVAVSMFGGGAVWCFYVGIEPFVRRHWPDSLISWNRLQAGRLHDPLIASHILIGILVGVTILPFGLAWNTVFTSGRSVFLPHIESLNGAANWTGDVFDQGMLGIFFSVGTLVVIVLLRLVARRVWIADLLWSAMFGIVVGGPFIYPAAADHVFAALLMFAFLWTLRRFGLLALIAVTVVDLVTLRLPMSLASWYAGLSLAAMLILAAGAAWALWVILSAKRRTESASA